MKEWVLLGWMLLVWQTESRSCLMYKCSSDLKQNECARTTYYNKTLPLVELKACENSSEVCNIVHWNDEPNLCAPRLSSPSLYPGEYCTANEECYSGHCRMDPNKKKRSVCVGLSEFSGCVQDADCDVGLFCNAKECVRVQPIGKPCNEQLKCAPEGVCNNGLCVLIGSIEDGHAASVPAACDSFYISGGKCEDGPTLDLDKSPDDPYACPADKTCKYTRKSVPWISQSCICGMSSEDKEYCLPGRGDIDSSDVGLWVVSRVVHEVRERYSRQTSLPYQSRAAVCPQAV
jgi:hypothetical protein